AGQQEEACRAQQQQLARDPPAVAYAATGRPLWAGLEPYRHLDRPQSGARSLHDHLTRELHPYRPERELLARRARQRTQTAAHIRDVEMQEPAGEIRLHRLEHVTVHAPHGARLDLTVPSRAEHHVVPGTERLDEAMQYGEIVRAVAIGDHDQLAVRLLHSAQACRAVAADRLM